MTPTPFSPEHMTAMAQLFLEEYSEPGPRQWNLETAIKYLQQNLEKNNQYCWVILNQKDIAIAGIFGTTIPYYQGELLFIDSIQVASQYRRQGLATKLLKQVLEVAQANAIELVHLLADARKGFPREWYEKLGFELSGWAEYEGETQIALSNLQH